MNAEAKLISAVCQNKDISVLFSSDVDILFTTHKDIWDGVKSYYYKYQAVPDVAKLQEKFRDFDPPAVKGETKYYLDDLRDKYIKGMIQRMSMRAAQDMEEKSGAEILNQMFAEASKLNRISESVRDVDLTNYEDAEEYFKAVAERSAAMGGSPGIPTGIKAIDSNYTTGMAPGHLIVAIGWPGKGKTWFTSWLAVQAWSRGFKPMIVSLEMSPEGMRNRLYTLLGSGQFRNSELNTGLINLDDFRSWGKKSFAEKQGFIICSSEGAGRVTANTVQAKIDQHRPDLVILDYHQLFDDIGGSKSTVESNKNISREFKLLAVKNNIPVIDITAATQDDISDRDNPPMLSQVAWSKAIEYDADMAFAVHKQDVESQDGKTMIEVVSRKNRHGGDFSFYLDWNIDKGIVEEVYA